MILVKDCGPSNHGGSIFRTDIENKLPLNGDISPNEFINGLYLYWSNKLDRFVITILGDHNTKSTHSYNNTVVLEKLGYS